MDRPYLLSCHFLSSVLLHYHFLNLLSPSQIQQAAIQFLTAGEYKNTCYEGVDAAKIKGHIQIICTVDPDMLCWRNFHLCYLFSFYLEKKKVNSLEPYQVKLRRKCWYYVIIFLRQRRAKFLLPLSSAYLKSATIDNALQKNQEFKKFFKKMEKYRMDHIDGLDNSHWRDVIKCTVTFSADDDNLEVCSYPTDDLPLSIPGPDKTESVKSTASLPPDTERSTTSPSPEVSSSYGDLLRVQLMAADRTNYRLLQVLTREKHEYQDMAEDIRERIKRVDIEIKELAMAMVVNVHNLKELMEHQIQNDKNPALQISLDRLMQEMPTYASAAKLVNYVNLSMLKDPSLDSVMVIEKWPKFPVNVDGKMEGKDNIGGDKDLEQEESIDLTNTTLHTPPSSPHKEPQTVIIDLLLPRKEVDLTTGSSPEIPSSIAKPLLPPRRSERVFVEKIKKVRPRKSKQETSTTSTTLPPTSVTKRRKTSSASSRSSGITVAEKMKMLAPCSGSSAGSSVGGSSSGSSDDGSSPGSSGGSSTRSSLDGSSTGSSLDGSSVGSLEGSSIGEGSSIEGSSVGESSTGSSVEESSTGGSSIEGSSVVESSVEVPSTGSSVEESSTGVSSIEGSSVVGSSTGSSAGESFVEESSTVGSSIERSSEDGSSIGGSLGEGSSKGGSSGGSSKEVPTITSTVASVRIPLWKQRLLLGNK